MIYALAILILAAAVCYVLGFAPGRGSSARVVALVGCLVALAVALQQEGLSGGGAGGAAVAWPWPDAMRWLGQPFYRSDTLAASLGAWCILLGGLCLLRTSQGKRTASRLAGATLIIATLYSLAYTNDLRAFAGEILLLVLLTWAILPGTGSLPTLITRQRIGQTAGALSLLGATLLVGRTTGGAYTLNTLTLSALTFWPMLLVLLFTIFWLGLAPFTGWSGLVESEEARGAEGALAQGLVIGFPVVVLVLRLQAAVTQQALAGSVPDAWIWLTGAWGWVGGITALVAGACTIVWAGTERWSSAVAAGTMGIITWALSLDNPTGRYAALAAFLAFGLARLTLALSAGRFDWLSRLAAGMAMVGTPLTAGFAGVWLLASGLQESRHPVLALLLVGAVVMSACGAALHLSTSGSGPHRPTSDKQQVGLPDGVLGLAALTVAAVSVLGGMLPGVWLPQVEAMSDIAGGGSRIVTGWAGLISGGLLSPLPLLAAGILLLAAIGWLLRLWAKAGSNSSGTSVLLPTAVARLQQVRPSAPLPTSQALLSNPPPAVWWLSMVWLERGIFGFGTLLNRLLARFGALLGRLEGRYYFPLALILTLLVLLAITR